MTTSFYTGDRIDLRGPKGEDGAEGPQGPIGPPGQDGKDGTNGTDGLDGRDGRDGDGGGFQPPFLMHLPYRVSGFAQAALEADEIILLHSVNTDLTFPQGLQGTTGRARKALSAPVVLKVDCLTYDTGSETLIPVGTLTFGLDGSMVPASAFPIDLGVGKDRTIRVAVQGTPPADAEDLAFTLYATQTIRTQEVFQDPNPS